jgi:hypothetical protein
VTDTIDACRDKVLNSDNDENYQAYFLSLGRFVPTFAKAETAIQYLLWYHAKTPENIAKSIFSGVRIKEGIGFVKRIGEATGAPPETKQELEILLKQLGNITDVRNHILHLGAQSIEDGNAFVTNEFLAHMPDRVFSFPISPGVLDNMTADLRKIILTLHWRHMGKPKLLSHAHNQVFQSIASAPWQYTHRSPLQAVRKVAEKSQHPRKRIPKQAPPPSS